MTAMPLFMDIHGSIDGVSPDEVYNAHVLDLQTRAKYGVEYLTYWFNTGGGKVFCLVQAPDRESCERVHREAHGLVADEIIEVQRRDVDTFMHLNEDQFPNPQTLVDGSGALDTAFRTIMFTDIAGSTPLTHELGDEAVLRIIRAHDDVVRNCVDGHRGRIVKHTGDGAMASFISASRAVECAMAIQREIAGLAAGAGAPLAVKIGLSAGEPVEHSNDIFGVTVQLARRVCDYGAAGEILAANVVKELCAGKLFQFADRGLTALKGFPEPVLLHEVIWSE